MEVIKIVDIEGGLIQQNGDKFIGYSAIDEQGQRHLIFNAKSVKRFGNILEVRDVAGETVAIYELGQGMVDILPGESEDLSVTLDIDTSGFSKNINHVIETLEQVKRFNEELLQINKVVNSASENASKLVEKCQELAKTTPVTMGELVLRCSENITHRVNVTDEAPLRNADT